MTSKYPALGDLRFALPSDIDRIALVAAAGFYHSTFFPYYRPRYHEFPQDTVASYRAEYMKDICDPQTVVLVALDDFWAHEIHCVYNALQVSCLQFYRQPYRQSKVDDQGDFNKAIVGVVSLSLRGNSKRHGLFNLEGILTSSHLGV